MKHTFSNNMQSGVTLLEVLVAVAIISVISTIIFTPLRDFRNRQTLDAAVEQTLAAFSAAHLDTMSSKFDRTYGVSINVDEVIYFVGETYPGDGDAGNVHFLLPDSIEIANVSISGGGTEVFYKRLSGATDEYGSFDIRVKSTPSMVTTVTINQTGVTSI